MQNQFIERRRTVIPDELKRAMSIVRGDEANFVCDDSKNQCQISDEIKSEAAKGKSDEFNSASMKPGKVMPDGTIFAGISPNSGEGLYVAPG